MSPCWLQMADLHLNNGFVCNGPPFVSILLSKQLSFAIMIVKQLEARYISPAGQRVKRMNCTKVMGRALFSPLCKDTPEHWKRISAS